MQDNPSVTREEDVLRIMNSLSKEQLIQLQRLILELNSNHVLITGICVDENNRVTVSCETGLGEEDMDEKIKEIEVKLKTKG